MFYEQTNTNESDKQPMVRLEKRSSMWKWENRKKLKNFVSLEIEEQTLSNFENELVICMCTGVWKEDELFAWFAKQF